MATFRFELDHKPTRNKTYNLYLMVTAAGKRTKKKTGIQLKRIDDFNPQCKGNNWIRANVPDAKVLNEQLRLMLVQANETYQELASDGDVSSAKVIKNLDAEYVSPSFMAFARERAQMIYDNGGWRNWRKYCGLINKLDAFRKKRRMADITVDDLTVDLLTRFDNFLHKWENEREPGKLLHPNTIEVQFNILRTLVHRAIEVGIMEASKDPFLVFKYKGVKTTKEKLSDTEMERIIALELEEGSLIWHCKNYFLFSYYCAGIRAADLIQLRWRNVTENGRLHYQMGKNHKDRDLVLVEQALEIRIGSRESRQGEFTGRVKVNLIGHRSYEISSLSELISISDNLLFSTGFFLKVKKSMAYCIESCSAGSRISAIQIYGYNIFIYSCLLYRLHYHIKSLRSIYISLNHRHQAWLHGRLSLRDFAIELYFQNTS